MELAGQRTVPNVGSCRCAVDFILVGGEAMCGIGKKKLGERLSPLGRVPQVGAWASPMVRRAQRVACCQWIPLRATSTKDDLSQGEEGGGGRLFHTIGPHEAR